MVLNKKNWATVTLWFERLAQLSPEERAVQLQQADLSEQTRHWLEQMLSAHDAPESMLVDRTIAAVTAELAGHSGLDLPQDWSGQRLNHWRVLHEIQRGGMATIVLAERDDGQYERQVAIKVLHSDRYSSVQRDGLMREIQLLAGLSHPNIVNMLDGGISEGGWPYLVMEYVDGLAIDDWCKRHQASLETRIGLLQQIADGLSYAHRKLVVHADIKPSNVLIDDSGHARLVDFGISQLLQEDVQQTLLPVLRCSPAWAPPEQLRGEPALVAGDVFGLGMLMYQLVTDCRPRSGTQVTHLLVGAQTVVKPAQPSLQAGTTTPAKRLRGDLDAICMKALAEIPDYRYNSAEAFKRDLLAWAEQRPVEARNGGRRYRLGKWLNRYRLPVSAGVLTVLALTVGASAALWQGNRATRALIATEHALDRAQQLNEFVIELFDAAGPLKPRDQLPTTQELLLLGAQRAMYSASASDVDRVGMLLTLANVYQLRNQIEAAEPLLDEARSITAQFTEQDAELDLRALLQSAQLDISKGDPSAAQQKLEAAAIRLNQIEQQPMSANKIQTLKAEYNAANGIFSLHTGDLDRAVDLLQPYRYIDTNVLSENSRRRALSGLAVTYMQLSRNAEAAEINAELLQLNARQYGQESLSYARTSANLGGSLHLLGRFAEANTALRRSLDLYDRIYTQPSVLRAAARHLLARSQLNQGLFDNALATMDHSSTEWAESYKERPVLVAYISLNRAMLLARIGRWEAVIRDTEAAIQQFIHSPPVNPRA
ncbi:MAG: serine/threonine-protein kinase, partial [Pseudomonadota bacterium]